MGDFTEAKLVFSLEREREFECGEGGLRVGVGESEPAWLP